MSPLTTTYAVRITPHPITWAHRDELAALWDGGLILLVRCRSAEQARHRVLAALPWRLCTAVTADAARA